jgi:hypothetical protein
MSGGPACHCEGRSNQRRDWRVLARLCNYSAFNGYRETPSAYSAVGCLRCHRVWRTTADYVRALFDDHGEWERALMAGMREPQP